MAPELRLLRRLVRSGKERVEADDLSVERSGPLPGGLVGQDMATAISRLESTWRGWDVYTLTKLYTHLIESICPWRLCKPPRNKWIGVILSELAKGWKGVGPRPGLLKIKRDVEQAWYEGGDVESCQAVIEALDVRRELRTGDAEDSYDLSLAARTD